MLKDLILDIIRHNQKLYHYHRWKNLYDQAIDSDIKRYEEIRKLTIGEGGNYTTGCLLDYDYIKNHFNLEQLIWLDNKI